MYILSHPSTLPDHVMLLQIIEAVTASPAKAINRAHQLGSLGLGKMADVTVLKLVPYDHPRDIHDTFGINRTVHQAFMPVAVLREGRTFPIAPRDHDPMATT